MEYEIKKYNFPRFGLSDICNARGMELDFCLVDDIAFRSAGVVSVPCGCLDYEHCENEISERTDHEYRVCEVTDGKTFKIHPSDVDFYLKFFEGQITKKRMQEILNRIFPSEFYYYVDLGFAKGFVDRRE